MSHQALKDKLHQLSVDSERLSTAGEKVKALSSAVEVANEIIKILNPNASGLNQGEDALEEIISTNSFRNTKVAEWFSYHPIYPDERLALKFYESDICEIKFYWLNDNSTKARISAGVMLTPNWEDGDTTENDNYKVGIDFFLKKDAKSLLMVVSERGNLRVMEFSDYLTHTQEEILDKIAGSLALPSRKAFHNVLWESMALSEVNRKFYEGIAHHFTILCQHLFASGKDKEDAKLFASRLLGRLLFIWFLRKKGVLSNENYYFPSDIEDSTKYYNSILKPLFFQVLNTPVYARKNGDTKTPYLNGGLFDAHENDWPYENTKFPTSFFLDLYDHLNKYNFTTDESSPDYEQVAIDPEMLGRVFESLLAEQMTDSGERVRKTKGTFYTPREIVSYMCKESLRQYLYKELGDEKYYPGIDKLLDSPDYEWETAHSNAKRDLWPFENMKKFIPYVIGVLDSLTVLDPACGSGAFPMGMLQLLTRTYERLDARFDPYQTKMNIIQNTIFGVDIEPMAVEISRLRAWLAIIVDDDGRIDPLPNLDFKFVCANSLVPLEQSVGLWDNKDLHEKMAEVREKYFNARKPESKDEWRRKYYKLTSVKNMFSGKREVQLVSFDPFKNQHPAKFFDPEYMFGVGNFDIVIENPPYVKNGRISNHDKQVYQSLYITPYDQWDLYVIFFEKSLRLLKENGTMCVISPNQWLSAKYGAKLRELLVDKVVSLTDFREYADFENASVNTFITICNNGPTQQTVKIIKADKSGRLDFLTVGRGELIKNSNNLGTILSSDIDVIEKIRNSCSARFGNYYDIGHSFSIPDYYKLSKIIYENHDPSKNERKLLNTGTVDLVGYNWGRKRFKYDGEYYEAPVVDVKQFNQTFPTRHLLTKPKLIMSSMGGLKICLDVNGEFLGTRPTMWLHANSEDDLYIAFSILNSSFIRWFYNQQYSVAGMTGFKVRYGQIQETPFPNIDPKTKQVLIDIVRSMILMKKSDQKADTNDLESQIDEIVFDLYRLTDEEKEIIRNF